MNKTEEIETFITFDHTDNPVQRYKDDIAPYKGVISKMFINAVNNMRCINSQGAGVTHKDMVIYFDLTLPKLGVEGFVLNIERKEFNRHWEYWFGTLSSDEGDDLFALRATFRLPT